MASTRRSAAASSEVIPALGGHLWPPSVERMMAEKPLTAGLLAVLLGLACSVLPSLACPFCTYPYYSPPPPKHHPHHHHPPPPPPEGVPCPTSHPPPPPPTHPSPPPPPPPIHPPPPPPTYPPPPPPIHPPPPPPVYHPPPPPPDHLKVVPCPPPPPPIHPPPPPPPPTYPPPPPPVEQNEPPCPPPPPPEAKPCPPPPASSQGCPIDTLKLDACVDILGGLVHIGLGPGASESCCPVLAGLADLDAAACLCTTLRAKVLDISIILPVALELLVDSCGKHIPSDFQCPSY